MIRISEVPSTPESGSDEVLLAEFGLSRALVLQWTAVSTVGFSLSLLGFLALYVVGTGDTSIGEFIITAGTAWWNLGLAFLAVDVLMTLVIIPHELCHGLAIRAFGGQS